jgi:hypothetical protein
LGEGPAASPAPHPEPGEGRFAPPAPGATVTRAQILDVAGATLGHYLIPFPDPPIYVQDGPLVFALQRSAPHPTQPETLAVYAEVAFYRLSAATPVRGD